MEHTPDERPLSPGEFTWLGGQLCLDFVNTVEGRSALAPIDLLANPDRLDAWYGLAGVVGGDSEPAGHDGIGAAAHVEALRFRDGLYSWLSALANGREPPEPAMEETQSALFGLVAQTRFDQSVVPQRLWAGELGDPRRPLWSIAWSALDLVRGPELARLRQCANADCRWLFVDRTRNRSRRWCDMKSCGNLAKARRFYRRSLR